MHKNWRSIPKSPGVVFRFVLTGHCQPIYDAIVLDLLCVTTLPQGSGALLFGTPRSVNLKDDLSAPFVDVLGVGQLGVIR